MNMIDAAIDEAFNGGGYSTSRIEKFSIDKDPNGKDPHEPGSKLDQDKVDTSLLLDFSKVLYEVANVGTVGAKKYSRGGWQTVPEGRTRYTAAMLRHLLAEQQETLDKETGMYHAAQVAWNALARCELLLRETGRLQS